MLKQGFKYFNMKLFNFETLLKLGSNQKGVSLAEVIAVSAVTSVLAIGSASLIAQSRSVANYGEFQTNLDARHMLNVQKVRNTQKFLEAIGLAVIATSNTANNCFRNNGSNCESFKVTDVPVPPIFYSSPGVPDLINGNSSDGLVTMSVRYSVDCISTRCTQIKISVATQPSQKALSLGLNGKVRRTDLTIPTAFLADKRSIDFTCAISGKILTKIDYRDLEGECTDYQATDVKCSGNLPPISYGNSSPGCYAASTSASCAGGLKSMGPFSGQAACN